MAITGPIGGVSGMAVVRTPMNESFGLRGVLNIAMPQQSAFQRSRFLGPKEKTLSWSWPVVSVIRCGDV